MWKFVLSCLCLFGVFAACNGRTRNYAVVDGGDASAPDAAIVDCTDINPSAAPGQLCCPTLGVDACSPNTHCASYDGRTLPVCYADHSRTRGQTCTASVACGTDLSCRVALDSTQRCLGNGNVGRGYECIDSFECMDSLECIVGTSNAVCGGTAPFCMNASGCPMATWGERMIEGGCQPATRSGTCVSSIDYSSSARIDGNGVCSIVFGSTTPCADFACPPEYPHCMEQPGGPPGVSCVIDDVCPPAP